MLSSKRHEYVISGLRVHSAIDLPSAIRAEGAGVEPDVVIALGEVPAHLPAPLREGPGWAIDADGFLLEFPGLMRAYMHGGHSIRVEPEGTVDPGDLVLFLLGTCFAIVLHQRGRVVLHASAVAVGDKAMLFCGQSGAGKSTMAALLGRRGFPLLNDDVCNLRPAEDGNYAVYADGRMLKLWAQSLEHLQWAEAEEAKVRRDTRKYYMAPEKVDLTPRPVGGVFVLHPSEDGSVSLERLSAAEATAELTRNAYRPALVHSMNMGAEYFKATIAIQQHAGVYRLSRPIDFSRADEVLDLLEKHWSGTA